MPKYCRAPNCCNIAGQLGSDNRPVSFYKFPLKDGPRLEAWLQRMGREHWVPSCNQHLCSEHFTPSCFQWRWGVRYLRPDAVPSIFSQVPPAKSQRRTRSTQKPVEPPPPTPPPRQEAAPGTPDTVAASGPVHVVVLGPASGGSEAASTVLLTPLPLPSTSAGRWTGVPAQRPQAGLGAVLGALQRRLPGSEESQTFTIICGGPDIAVVLAQGPAPATLDAKPQLDTQSPSA
uniref:THAP domain containing 8 n=1 Tax=Sciurus vulgaris TaxID=55149 RepID=A0A8D2CZQ7_SCIVU